MMFQTLAQKENTKLLYRLHEDFPALIYGDSNRLQQVLINLINNAFKFTKNGFIKIYAYYNKAE